MSIPFQLIKYERAEAHAAGRRTPGGPAEASAFRTIRIANKVEMRRDLEQTFGYSERGLFPDFPGFRDYGKTWKSAT